MRNTAQHLYVWAYIVKQHQLITLTGCFSKLNLYHMLKNTYINHGMYVCTKMNLISNNMLRIPFCRLIAFANLLRFYQTLCPELFSKCLFISNNNNAQNGKPFKHLVFAIIISLIQINYLSSKYHTKSVDDCRSMIKTSLRDVGGFHLHLLALPFVYQVPRNHRNHSFAVG